MPPKNKLPLCKELVKGEVTLTVGPCGTQVILRDQRFFCPKNDSHLLKYKTGFCQNNNCEGSAKKSHNGKPMKTCSWWLRCPCECHKVYDSMYKMSEMPRVLVNNSGYEPELGGFRIPSAEERVALHGSSSSTPAITLPDIERTVATPEDRLPAMMRRDYAPTPTGIAARGELESWVKDQCDAWLVETEEFPCTPPYLSKEIAKAVGLGKAPSVGAISSVFDRWEKIGFAEIQRKPTRFVKYTEQGIKVGLDGLKALRKRSRKFEDAKTKRGVLR